MKNIKVTYETINRSKQLFNIFMATNDPHYVDEKYYGTCDITFKEVPDDVARLFLEDIEDYKSYDAGWLINIVVEDVVKEEQNVNVLSNR